MYNSLGNALKLKLEAGGTIDYQPTYTDYGTYTGNNAVLICHTLTGNSKVHEWWPVVLEALLNQGMYVVCIDVYTGQGTIRDQTALERAVLDSIGVPVVELAMGGSMGAMRVLEHLVMFPGTVRRAWVGASSAWTTAEQIALNNTQILAAELGRLDLARRIALISYRTEDELAVRFARDTKNGQFEVENYLQYQCKQFVKRFDTQTYINLVQSMNTHDLGRGRKNSTAQVLQTINVPTTIWAAESDRLYPLRLHRFMKDNIKAAELKIIKSLYGHDSILIEQDSIASTITMQTACKVMGKN